MAEPALSSLRGAHAIVEALEQCGVSLVPSVPDTWIGALVGVMRRSRKLRVLDVAREEEAVAIACGAGLVGARAAVVIQNGGLLNCGAVIGSLVHLYRAPCFFFVSYRGDQRDPVYYHVPKGRVTEPTLTAWGVRYDRAAGGARTAEQIRRGFGFMEEAREPYALLFSAEDLA